MTIDNSIEYAATCKTVIEGLNELAEYTNGGTEEQDMFESAWMFLVLLSVRMLLSGAKDDDGGSDYQIDGELF